MLVIATHIDVGDPSQQGGEGAVLGSDILPCLNHTEEEKASSVSLARSKTNLHSIH